MYTLYSMSGTCSSAIHTLLNALNQPVDIVFHTDVENYSEINPTGQVPALATPDGLLVEGAAICQYLIEKHHFALPCEPLLFNQKLMFNFATLHPAYSKMFTVYFEMPDSEQKTELLSILAKKVEKLWAILDKSLESQPFVGGNEVSVLDYLITIYASWGNVFENTHITLGKNVTRVAEQVAKLPEFKAVIAKEAMQFSVPKAA